MTLKEKFWFGVVIVALAIVVATLYAAPQLLIRSQIHSLGQDFVLSQFTSLDDGGDVYFQFAREVVDGHFPPGDLFFAGNIPNLFPPIPPLLLAGLVVLFKDINFAYIAANFIFSGILFLLFYVLGMLVFGKRRLWSIFMGFLGTLTPIAINIPWAFLTPANILNVVIKNFYPGIQTILPVLFLARIDYPLLTSLIYLPAIIFLFLFWQKPSQVKAILAGLFGGLLFYTYFHIWVYWVIVVGLLFLYTFLFRRKEKEMLNNFFVFIGVMILLSVPYFLNQIQLNHLAGTPDYLNRLELEVGRTFRWWAWRHFVAYLAIGFFIRWTFWRRSEFRSKAILYYIFILAAFAVWHIQLIIGFVPHSDHWPRAISLPLFVVVADLIFSWVRLIEIRWPNLNKTIAVFLTILIVLLVTKKIVNITKFISVPQETLNNYVFPQGLVNSWYWLDINLKEPEVISPAYLTSIYLTAFTSVRPFLPWGGATAVTTVELEEIFLEANKALEVPPEIVEARLRLGKNTQCLDYCNWLPAQTNIEGTRTFLYGRYFKGVTPDYNPPEDRIQALIEHYRKMSFNWKTTRADYLYYGPFEKQFVQSDFSSNSNLMLVYKNEAVSIYKIKK